MHNQEKSIYKIILINRFIFRITFSILVSLHRHLKNSCILSMYNIVCCVFFFQQRFYWYEKVIAALTGRQWCQWQSNFVFLFLWKITAGAVCGLKQSPATPLVWGMWEQTLASGTWVVLKKLPFQGISQFPLVTYVQLRKRNKTRNDCCFFVSSTTSSKPPLHRIISVDIHNV